LLIIHIGSPTVLSVCLDRMHETVIIRQNQDSNRELGPKRLYSELEYSCRVHEFIAILNLLLCPKFTYCCGYIYFHIKLATLGSQLNYIGSHVRKTCKCLERNWL